MPAEVDPEQQEQEEDRENEPELEQRLTGLARLAAVGAARPSGGAMGAEHGTPGGDEYQFPRRTRTIRPKTLQPPLPENVSAADQVHRRTAACTAAGQTNEPRPW